MTETDTPMITTLDALKDRYDCIVIGGGIGGLTAANRVASFGRSVLVLEQHSVLGGLAAYFRRKGYIFDTALHGFPVGMKKSLRKYWSKEMADCVIQLDSVRYDNPQFKLDTTFDVVDYSNKLVEHFGIPRETVDRFFETCRSMNFYDDRDKSTRELFEEFFPGRSDVMRFLVEPITYANGSNLNDPAITYGIVFSNFMSKGIFFFQGGTDKFVAMCEAELGKNGVDIVLGATAEKILAENGKASGVVVNGKTVATDCVISNGNLQSTVLDMVDPGVLPAAFVEKTRAMRLSTSISQVYIGLTKEIPFMGDVIFHSHAPEFSPEGYIDFPPQSRSFSVYYPKSRPQEPTNAVVASMGANPADWEHLSDEEYKAKKQQLVDQTLDILRAEYLPDLDETLDYVEAATPRTFARYTLHPGGATFGTKFEGLEVSEELPKVLPGAFHTGSCAIIMSGWLGAANYGAIVANHAIEYLDGLAR